MIYMTAWTIATTFNNCLQISHHFWDSQIILYLKFIEIKK